MVTVSVNKTIEELKKTMGRGLSDKQINKAIASAINHTMNVSKTAAVKAIRENYKLKAGIIRKDMRVIRANLRNYPIQGILEAKGGGIPLIKFDAIQLYEANVKPFKQDKRKKSTVMGPRAHVSLAGGLKQLKKKAGVQIKIKGKTQKIPGAFIANMKSGHEGIFARGSYGKGEFNFRKQRIAKRGNDLPIAELRTYAIPQLVANNTVVSIVQNKMKEHFPKRLGHELTRLGSPSSAL